MCVVRKLLIFVLFRFLKRCFRNLQVCLLNLHRRIYCVSTSRRIVVPVNYFIYFIIVLRYLSTILFIIVFFYYISRASSM